MLQYHYEDEEKAGYVLRITTVASRATLHSPVAGRIVLLYGTYYSVLLELVLLLASSYSGVLAMGRTTYLAHDLIILGYSFDLATELHRRPVFSSFIGLASYSS